MGAASRKGLSLSDKSRDIQWERSADGSIEIRPVNSGCSSAIGMGLVVIGTFSALLPILQQVSLLRDAAPIAANLLGWQSLAGMIIGMSLIFAGATLVFSERRVVVDASRGEVSFVRQLLFWRSVRCVPKAELEAVGVRSHEAEVVSGATPRIAHFTHDVLIFRHKGDPLVIEHTRWENKAEAQELAAAIAASLGIELL